MAVTILRHGAYQSLRSAVRRSLVSRSDGEMQSRVLRAFSCTLPVDLVPGSVLMNL